VRKRERRENEETFVAELRSSPLDLSTLLLTHDLGAVDQISIRIAGDESPSAIREKVEDLRRARPLQTEIPGNHDLVSIGKSIRNRPKRRQIAVNVGHQDHPERHTLSIGGPGRS
jgi:hypothetical protein